MSTQPDRADAEAADYQEHVAARLDARRRLADLDREWTPDRWARARREQLDELNAA